MTNTTQQTNTEIIETGMKLIEKGTSKIMGAELTENQQDLLIVLIARFENLKNELDES